MTLFIFGINHTTATVAIREQVALAPQHIAQALQDLLTKTTTTEAVILSTCNRTEVYGSIPDDATDDPSLLVANWLAQFHQLSIKFVQQHSYFHQQEDMVRHIMRVACGLDSLVLGEPQILGQLKSAYDQAQQEMAVSSQLMHLFQYTFNTAKQVRTHTAIGENSVSVAFSAVRMASYIFTDMSQQTALLIGAGKTIELVGLHLRTAKVKQIIVANRTLSHAQKLAIKIGHKTKAVLLTEVPKYLATADIVISSAASQLPIIGKGLVERALHQRRHQPMLMVDIAVPRNIEAEVDNLEDVYLYTVDDLKDVIDENIKTRQRAADMAELMINTKVKDFLTSLRTLDAVSLIQAYRGKMEQLRDAEVANSLNRLKQGANATEVVQMLGYSLINKITHAPTVQLRKSSAAGCVESMRLMQQIFDFKE